MGAMSGLFGTAGGVNGTGMSGPTGTTMTNPTTADQIQGAYGGTQNSMASQQALLQALQGQNGLGNQSQVYNQMQGVVNGTGPNPAQAMLNQSTGTNVANQAALMAGQRGAGANVGLMARQAGQQGAATQQQAAGQAATLQANQSLNALNNAGSIANTQATNQIGQTNANTQSQQAEQAALINAQAGINANNVSMQGNINNVNGQLANTTMQGQQGLIGGMMNSVGPGAASSMMSAMAAGGEVGDADEPVGNGSTPSFGSDAAAGAFSPPQSSGGGGGGLGALALLAAAQGGQVPAMADGGDMSAFSGPQSKFGQYLASTAGAPVGSSPTPGFGSDSGAAALQKGAETMFTPQQSSGDGGAQSMAGGPDASDLTDATSMVAAKGGMVPALVSPGERYLSPQAVEQVKRGADPMRVGETIPGQPRVGGAKNSYSNDFVKKDLQEGGIVVPRSETKSKNPDKNSADFVMKTLAKRKGGR